MKPRKATPYVILLCISALLFAFTGICSGLMSNPDSIPSDSPEVIAAVLALVFSVTMFFVGLFGIIVVSAGNRRRAKTSKNVDDVQNAAPATVSSFNFTGGIPKHLLIDEKSQVWCIPDGRNGELINPRIHTYDDIISFELDATEELITKSKKGIGRAVAGGALFGPAGAIVGAATGKQKATTQTKKSVLGVKIIVNDLSNPTEYISLLRSPIGTGTKIMSMLTVMQSAAQKQANAADQQTHTPSAAQD